MDIIRIGKDKLKVTMNETDMKRLELDFDSIDGESADTRAALRHILDEAKDKCGFDASNERMLVRLFPSRRGGCEIFVTLLGGAEKMKKEASAVYAFDETDGLISACTAMERSGFDGESEAFVSDTGRTFLSVSGYSYLPVVSEYGEAFSNERFDIIRGEHLRVIASPDAVHTLSRYDVR